MKQHFIDIEKTYRQQVAKDIYRAHYHLMAPVGWLNDPNGLCQYRRTYHISYQYSPAKVQEASYPDVKKGWGH